MKMCLTDWCDLINKQERAAKKLATKQEKDRAKKNAQ